MKLVISLATRGRPDELTSTVKDTMPHIACKNTVLMLCMDADDAAGIGAAEVLSCMYPQVKLSIGPREDSVGGKWNRALAIPGDLYLLMADNNPYVSPAFDARLLEAAQIWPDGIGMVHGRLVNGSFPGTMAVTARFAELFGDRILPTHFSCWFADHWLDEISYRIGRRAYCSSITRDERKHTTQELREPDWWANWFDAAYMLRRAEADRLIEALDEPEWRKRNLREMYPFWEQRSAYINDVIRSSARMWTRCAGWPHDERYAKKRAKALDMLPSLLEHLPKEEADRYCELLIPPSNIINLKSKAHAAA